MKKNIFRGLMVDDVQDAKVILTGIPFDKNASIGKGASLEPEVMRELSQYFPPLTKDGHIITDYKMYDNGDIVQKDGEDVETYFARIEENVFTSMNYGKFNLFIGGDHSIAIPTEKAFLRYCQKINKIPAIIHLDAHPDICDTYEGSKYSHACPNRRSIDNGYKTSDMVLIGMRGYEAQEVEYFAAHPEIEVYNSSYVQNHGIEEMLEHIKNKFDDRYLIYLSYDVDINDPSFAPGTGTPEPFGLDNLTVLKIIKYLVANLPIGALDIVEISPKIDSNDITTWLGLKTLYEVFELLEKK